MKPNVKALIWDIQEYINAIKESSPKDHFKVYHMYTEIHDRCYNLQEADFWHKETYYKYLQQIIGAKIDTAHVNGLKYGHEEYTRDNYILTLMALSQMPTVIKSWVGKIS